MFFIYRFLINIIFLISPIIIILRLIKKKEDIRRFKEKFCFFTKRRVDGALIWFHGASVGEIHSVIPLIEKFEKNKNINQILITSNTISSSTIIEKLKLKKTIHQFFPIDTNFTSKKFIQYWKPSKVFFIDSEIWPNTLNNLNQNKIPTILLNARITKRSFNRWMIFSNFARTVFKNFNLCLSSSKETKRYLQKLGANNIKYFGNLKFSQSENETDNINSEVKNFINSRKSWCASSTHNQEEKFCGLAHLKLKKKYKNIFGYDSHCEEKILSKLKINQNIDRIKLKVDIVVFLVNHKKYKSLYNYFKKQKKIIIDPFKFYK